MLIHPGHFSSGRRQRRPEEGYQRADLVPLADEVWRLEVGQVGRLKELEQDNTKLKSLMAGLSLDNRGWKSRRPLLYVIRDLRTHRGSRKSMAASPIQTGFSPCLSSSAVHSF